MWKFLSRGVRETFERRIGFSRKDKKATGQDCPLTALQNKLIPGIVSSHTFDSDCKDGSCGDKKEQRRERQGTRWQSTGCPQQPRLLGALGWSGVMVLGWYLCQPICQRQRTQLPELQRRTEYVSLLSVLSRVVLAQPLGVLPQPVDAVQFGPVTAEQAVDEAAEGLAQAHNAVLGGMENRLGMACLQLGQQKEAVTHFRSAAVLGCAPAAFNLGLCHELGVGTAQDLKQAVCYYEKAAEEGHATAMYNLGVFCVRGWGGLPVDCARARRLFKAAAELGQTDAQEALAMLPVEDSARGGLLAQLLGLLKARESASAAPLESDDTGIDTFVQNDFSIVC